MALDTIFKTLNATDGNDVSQEHFEYTKHKAQIQLVNDVFEGIDTTKQYLNQFPQESLATYQERQERATLRNFVKRSVEAFVGMIFRKPIDISGYGPKVSALLPKIDTVNSIQSLTRNIAGALIKDSKTYLLVDSPNEDVDGATPYVVPISRNQLINWRKNEKGEFTMIVIREIVAEAKGLFGTVYIEQFRVYDSEANITLWRSNTDKKKGRTSAYKQYGEKIITGFDKIPLVEMALQDVPILYDIAKMNIKYFNRQSHKDRYLTMAALPIPVIWGADIDSDGQTTTAKPALVIGVDEAFIFSGTKQEADFEWRELKGDSIQALEDDLNSIVEDITTGVIRAADSANAVQKTATEIQLLQAEASNRVTVIASILEKGMKDALELLAYVSNETIPEKAAFIISKDFNSALMGSDGARVVYEQYLQGLLSTETFLQSMSDFELINIGSAADEIIRIQEDKFQPKPRFPKEELPNTTDNRTKAALNQ